MVRKAGTLVAELLISESGSRRTDIDHMIPWQLLDRAAVPGTGEKICLYRRGDGFQIRVEGYELMNSRLHASEEALARLACARIAGRRHPRVLIGGLGMGFTTAATLGLLPAQSHILVAELVPAVVAWNRGPLAHLASHPLDDPRVIVCEGDVGGILRGGLGAYDAILLDVDNGPDGLTSRRNDRLYSPDGVQEAWKALRADGVLAVWSSSPDSRFSRRLREAGFQVEQVSVRAGPRGGGRRIIWLAQRVG
jgi:spermidine synthase